MDATARSKLVSDDHCQPLQTHAVQRHHRTRPTSVPWGITVQPGTAFSCKALPPGTGSPSRATVSRRACRSSHLSLRRGVIARRSHLTQRSSAIASAARTAPCGSIVRYRCLVPISSAIAVASASAPSRSKSIRRPARCRCRRWAT
jgi:hypothetical protein